MHLFLCLSIGCLERHISCWLVRPWQPSLIPLKWCQLKSTLRDCFWLGLSRSFFTTFWLVRQDPALKFCLESWGTSSERRDCALQWVSYHAVWPCQLHSTQTYLYELCMCASWEVDLQTPQTQKITTAWPLKACQRVKALPSLKIKSWTQPIVKAMSYGNSFIL